MANNQVFSPLSIGMSLTSLQLGARGRTREQLAHLLDLSSPGSSSAPGGNEPHEGLIAAADAFFAEHMVFARAGFKFSHAGELFCNSDIQVLLNIKNYRFPESILQSFSLLNVRLITTWNVRTYLHVYFK